jgi:hypothetical protein
MAAKTEKKTTANPFAVRGSGAAPKKSSTPLLTDAPESVREAVDNLVDLSAKVKALESELAEAKNEISYYARRVWAERAIKGTVGNFRIEGNLSSALWMTQERGSMITAEDREALAADFGEKMIDELVEIDYASFRLNPEIMQDAVKAERVQQVLGDLTEELGESVLLPGAYKVGKGILEKASRACKSVEKLVELLQKLKITAYPRK